MGVTDAQATASSIFQKVPRLSNDVLATVGVPGAIHIWFAILPDAYANDSDTGSSGSVPESLGHLVKAIIRKLDPSWHVFSLRTQNSSVTRNVAGF